jgi:CheY-like chemotaxis protein
MCFGAHRLKSVLVTLGAGVIRPTGDTQMRILVVEDEWLVRELVVEELREAGFEVVDAATGDEAVTRFAEHRADVLLTDIRLPGALDGWEIAERCREAKPALPVIYMTGYCEQARMVPGAVLLRKPFRIAQIVAAIEQLTQAT